MALRLSSKEMAAIEYASTVLLSPFSFDTGESWRRAAAHAVEVCIGAETSSFALPIPDEPLIAADSDVAKALRAVDPPPDWVVEGLTTRRRSLGLEVTDWEELFEPNQVRQTTFYNEVVRPQRLLAPLVMLTDSGNSAIPAAVSVYFDSEAAAGQRSHRGKQIMRLLHPSFCAGVRTYTEFVSSRAAFAAITEDAGIGAVAFDTRGVPCWENEFFRRLIASDPARERVRCEVACAGRSCVQQATLRGAPASAKKLHREVRTAVGHYRITATYLGKEAFGGRCPAVGLIASMERKPITPGDLTSRFALTRREVEIAQLMRRGLSTRWIAAELEVSVNTVRRHVERILLKLDVHSRTAAVARLSGDAGSPQT
jgi:DNA-binding CsgD family transcriptional regulator